jgi:hypothetical protein
MPLALHLILNLINSASKCMLVLIHRHSLEVNEENYEAFTLENHCFRCPLPSLFT